MLEIRFSSQVGGLGSGVRFLRFGEGDLDMIESRGTEEHGGFPPLLPRFSATLQLFVSGGCCYF